MPGMRLTGRWSWATGVMHGNWIIVGALVGVYFGIVAVTGEIVHSRLSPQFGFWGLLAAIIIAGVAFEPLKRTIQAWVDRVFDQKRFDYRETLVEFGRGINSQTDLRTLLDSIVERLPQALLVTRVAVFLASEGDGLRQRHWSRCQRGVAGTLHSRRTKTKRPSR